MRKLFVSCTLFCILGIFFFFIPNFFSTSIGKPFFERALSQKIGGKVSVETLHLTWKGPQEFQKVSFSTPQMEGTLETLSSNIPLWRLGSFSDLFFLKNGQIAFPRFGSLRLEHVEAKIEHKDLTISGTTSQGGSFQLQGRVAENRLTLTQPFSGSLQLTEEMLQALNGRVIDAKNPITLQLSAGSVFPLTSFSWEKILISQGTLELGQLICHGFPSMTSFFAMLNHTSIINRTAPIWFTPIRFSLKEGFLTIHRTDALIAGAIHVCGWGIISLPSTKIEGVFGLPADTLENSLGITGLSHSYVLQIPVRGTVDKLKFKSDSATAKIAALVTAQQLAKKTGPFSPLINRATGPKEDENTPKPFRPFPWEK